MKVACLLLILGYLSQVCYSAERPCEKKCRQICEIMKEVYKVKKQSCSFCSCYDAIPPTVPLRDCSIVDCGESEDRPPPVYNECEEEEELECPPGCTPQISPNNVCPECICKSKPEETKLRLRRSEETVRCKLRQFAVAHSVKYLNSKGSAKCEDEEEEEEEDEDEDTFEVDEENNKGGLSKEIYAPKLNPLTPCKLQDFIGVYQTKNLNVQTKKNCNDRGYEIDDDIDTSAGGSPRTKKIELPKGCKIITFSEVYQAKNLNVRSKIFCKDEDEEDEEED